MYLKLSYFFIFFLFFMINSIQENFSFTKYIREKKSNYLMVVELHRLLEKKKLSKENYPKAKKLTLKAIKYYPKKYSLYLIYGDFLAAENEFKKALKYYNIFLKNNKNPNFHIHHKLALAYMNLGDHESEKFYKKALLHEKIALHLFNKFQKTLILMYDERNTLQLFMLLNTLASIYAKNKNWQKAFEIQLKAINNTYNYDLKNKYEAQALLYLKQIQKGKNK